MQPTEKQYDVGVLVGRFQVHELHNAHRELIKYVCDRHDKVIIFLGLSPLSVSTNNPLDFEARKQMILAEFPEANVLYVKDLNNDRAWSHVLDDNIANLVAPGQSVVLYGGRDSFISHYTGNHPTQELTQTTFYSGRAQRKDIARSRAKSSPEFRAGVIWASQARFPTAYTTVDVAILKDVPSRERKASQSWIDCRSCQPRTACPVHRDEAAAFYATEKPLQLLLGRKPNETLYRFIGGFSDPRSDSFEADAKREVQEETSLNVEDVRYVGSLRVDDWRYRNEPDCIKTMLFTAQYTHGRPTPGDDIEEVKWIDLPDVKYGKELGNPVSREQFYNNLVPEHRPLMGMLVDYLNRKES